ncbi:DUF2075 domain-containing protein [Sporolactobacillus pectinivorans]|uniref:DUF2075 domain-containing protein n=1 Tax=Sporolactobacillus pectinivorans TaxID=1591408 RepID=UPI000C25AE79|nr:DUF2075 domain-containing protein [Sporolactobacillus pectinivorans]
MRLSNPLEKKQDDRAVYKLSPFKKLSFEQSTLKGKIVAFCRAHVKEKASSLFVIHGEAGTGKSVVLSSTFNDIQSLSKKEDPENPFFHTANRLIVNHPEMIKLYKEISEALPDVRKKDIERPTTFINQMQKQEKYADIVFIDEAHLLLTRSDKYNKFNQNNQLEEIIKRSSVVVMIFDEQQVLKLKSYWNEGNVRHFMSRFPSGSYHLTHQFRIHANSDVMMWIKGFVHKRVLPLPKDQSFDFRIFEDADAMYQAIKKKNEKYHLSRMVSTYDYPYKLDGQDYFIHEKNFELRWDREKPGAKKAWAERDDTIDEVGSVYTVQGFDLNYAGVILGPSVSYNRASDRIKIMSEYYEDQAAFLGSKNLKDSEAVKEQIILNSINVLMTRGVHGLYIYASDPKLKRKLISLK